MAWNLESADLAEELASFCKGLADPKRLKLLAALRTSEQSVGELSRMVGATQPSVSHHLGVLRSKGLVEVRREGTTAFYRASDRRVIEAIDRLYGALRRDRFDGHGPPPGKPAGRSGPPSPPKNRVSGRR